FGDTTTQIICCTIHKTIVTWFFQECFGGLGYPWSNHCSKFIGKIYYFE
ncbi:unnamed protein product, partial [Allacma fusca]